MTDLRVPLESRSGDRYELVDGMATVFLLRLTRAFLEEYDRGHDPL